MYGLGSAVLGGHLVLGLSVWGTHSPRTSCPGGHVRGGTYHTMTSAHCREVHRILPIECICAFAPGKEGDKLRFDSLLTFV